MAKPHRQNRQDGLRQENKKLIEIFQNKISDIVSSIWS